MSAVLELDRELKWGDFLDPNDYSKGKYFPLHSDQLKILESTTRFTAACAGTGGGKTAIGPVWAIKKMQEHYTKTKRPVLGMVVAPTYKVLERATVPTLIDTLRHTAFEGVYKESTHKYVLPDGGLIWCQGADNAGGLEGGQFDWIWLDEGGQVRFSVWMALTSRTGFNRAPILITTTPYGKNWLYYEFYKKFIEKDPNYLVVQWSSNKNPAYSTEEYERGKHSLTKEKAAMRYDGQFMALEGLIYPDITSCFVNLNGREIIELLSNPGKFYGGLDFGWNDPFAGLCGFLDTNDVLWIWYERYKSKTVIEEHAKHLPKIHGRTVKWFAEHEPELIKKLRRGGHKVKRANKAIIAGIEAVNARINTGRLKIVAALCPATVVEGEAYIYDIDEDNQGGENPMDENNHCMDALRYLIMGIDVKKAA